MLRMGYSAVYGRIECCHANLAVYDYSVSFLTSVFYCEACRSFWGARRSPGREPVSGEQRKVVSWRRSSLHHGEDENPITDAAHRFTTALLPV